MSYNWLIISKINIVNVTYWNLIDIYERVSGDKNCRFLLKKKNLNSNIGCRGIPPQILQLRTVLRIIQKLIGCNLLILKLKYC